MLRLSKKADYALMAMKHLAEKGGASSTSAREIAEQYDIPLELMAKVLQRLVRNGLLASTQGTRGGYILQRSPETITVRMPRAFSATSASRAATTWLGKRRPGHIRRPGLDLDRGRNDMLGGRLNLRGSDWHTLGLRD